MKTICHTLLNYFSGYAIKSNSDNSNILLLNFYELWNIFSCNFKFQFHKYIFTIYLRETKYCKTNRNMHFNIHIIISSNYIPFHANYDIKNTLCNFHILYFETQIIYCNSNSSFPKLNIKQNNIMYHSEFKCNHAALIKVIVNLFQDNKFRRHIISTIFHKNIMCIFTKGLYKIPSNKNNKLYNICYYKCTTLYICNLSNGNINVTISKQVRKNNFLVLSKKSMPYMCKNSRQFDICPVYCNVFMFWQNVFSDMSKSINIFFHPNYDNLQLKVCSRMDIFIYQ